MKKWHYLLGVLIISLVASSALCYAQQDNLVEVKGVVDDISYDDHYLMIDGKKIQMPDDFMQYCDIEKNDDVVVLAEQGDNGLVAYDYYYADTAEQPGDEGMNEAVTNDEAAGDEPMNSEAMSDDTANAAAVNDEGTN